MGTGKKCVKIPQNAKYTKDDRNESEHFIEQIISGHFTE